MAEFEEYMSMFVFTLFIWFYGAKFWGGVKLDLEDCGQERGCNGRDLEAVLDTLVTELSDEERLFLYEIAKIIYCFVRLYKLGSPFFKLMWFCLHISCIWFKGVLIGQFPSNSVKSFRKIERFLFRRSPLKFFDKVFDAGLHDQRTLSKKTVTKF